VQYCCSVVGFTELTLQVCLGAVLL